MKAFSLNLVIATIWLLLSPSPSPAAFALGFLVGFLIVALFRPALKDAGYVRRAFGLLTFVLRFLHEFILANATVAWTVLFRTPDSLHPNFLTYDLTGLTRVEILLLSYFLTLTPGTTAVQISGDFRTLVIHALDADAPDQIRASIDERIKKPMLKFTR